MADNVDSGEIQKGKECSQGKLKTLVLMGAGSALQRVSKKLMIRVDEDEDKGG